MDRGGPSQCDVVSNVVSNEHHIWVFGCLMQGQATLSGRETEAMCLRGSALLPSVSLQPKD